MICKNVLNKFCDENVHNIIKQMGQGRFCDKYEKCSLFASTEYPLFKGQECIQYLQEYVPFHLPQIEPVLSAVMRESSDLLNNPVNIMDLCSGPATVPLAFCRCAIIRYRLRDSRNLKITTVEPSTGFNAMINIFKATNANIAVEIVNTLKYELFEDNFMNDESVFRTGYDWIIIANSISAIGKGSTYNKVNTRLNKLISKVLCYSDKVLLTIIESNQTKYFNSINYLSKIEEIGFRGLRIIKTISTMNEQLSVPEIMNCEFYKTKYPDHYLPYINSKTLLLELR